MNKTHFAVGLCPHQCSPKSLSSWDMLVQHCCLSVSAPQMSIYLCSSPAQMLMVEAWTYPNRQLLFHVCRREMTCSTFRFGHQIEECTAECRGGTIVVQSILSH